MKNMKREVIGEAYEDAGPILSNRSIAFLKVLGLKKAKKRVVHVEVRNALFAPPLKDGGLSIARVIRFEIEKVKAAKFERLLSSWMPTDEEFEPGDEPEYFVTGKIIECDFYVIYSLANGGFLVLECDDDDSPNIFVYLYRDYGSIRDDYPPRVLDQVLAMNAGPLPTPTEKEPASQSPNITIDQARKIRVMDLLAKHNFEVSITQADVEDVVDGRHQMSIAVFPSGGGSWSDSYDFTEGDSDSYFQALEKATSQWLTENEPQTKRRKLSKDEF